MPRNTIIFVCAPIRAREQHLVGVGVHVRLYFVHQFLARHEMLKMFVPTMKIIIIVCYYILWYQNVNLFINSLYGYDPL